MRLSTLLALSLVLALPTAALADKGGNPNKGKGHDKDWQAGPPGKGPGGPPGHAKKFGSNDHAAIQAYYGRRIGTGHCPPGLAKKNNGCLPPGQAKRWNVGQALAPGVAWHAVPQELYVRLTPPPYGYRYVYLDGAVLLLNVGTRLVLDAVSINISIR